MPTTLKTISVLALLATAAPLAAQEAPAEAPAAEEPSAEAPAEDPAAAAPETPAEGTAPEPGGDLTLGQTAEGTAEVGQPYIREEFGAWGLRCLRTEDGNDPCQLYQLLLDAEGNAVAEISLFPLPEGREAVAGATIVAPLETLLTENLTLSVDGANSRQYPFNFCNRAGCVARVGFTAAEVDQFRAGNAAQLSIVPAAAPDQQVALEISLSGFTAGYEAAGQSAPTIPPQ
jgi:invasion protein IalB